MSGAGCIASPLDAPPTTDCVWLDQKRLLAWQSKTQGQTMPAAQILGPRWVLAGPRDIVDIVGTAELGRGFPTRELGFEDGTVPLLDVLKTGRAQEVIGAVQRIRSDLS